MKKIIILTVLLLLSFEDNLRAQEKYGNTLNMGLGIGYYGYVQENRPPVIHANFEIDVVNNFTLAPFITYFTYRRYQTIAFKKDYYYSETVIPMGVKGTYYFDNYLVAGPNWDFYLAGSLGFVYSQVQWSNTYFGDRSTYSGASRLYLDLHIGTEYHLSEKLGLNLDFSSGVSTVGIGIHF